jgi:hypothetical protein
MDSKIIETLTRIETKLDAVIKALHEYDGNDEYGESSFEAFQLTNEYLSSFDVDGAERRVDIIGQNEGSHYVTNEEADEDAATFNDYGMRVVKDKDNNTQDKRTGGNKKKYKGKRKFTQDLIPKTK